MKSPLILKKPLAFRAFRAGRSRQEECLTPRGGMFACGDHKERAGEFSGPFLVSVPTDFYILKYFFSSRRTT